MTNSVSGSHPVTYQPPQPARSQTPTKAAPQAQPAQSQDTVELSSAARGAADVENDGR